jgi:hypothetical protein
MQGTRMLTKPQWGVEGERVGLLATVLWSYMVGNRRVGVPALTSFALLCTSRG